MVMLQKICICQPEGYVADGQEHLVCKLLRSVYGLKQSARAWNTKVNDILLQNKFVRSKSDPCCTLSLRTISALEHGTYSIIW